MRKSILSNKRTLILGIVTICLITVFFLAPLINFWGDETNLKYSEQYNSEFNLKSANNGIKPLNYSSIYQNATLPINRLFESIYFNVNISGFTGVNSTIMQISYQNNAYANFTMSKLNNDEFEYTYTPEFDAPLGFHRVNFFIFNQTNALLNTHTTYVNFTIISNYIGMLDDLSYSRGDLVYGEFKINDYGSHTFTWDLSLVDNLNESLEDTLFTLGSDLEYFYFELNESFVDSSSMYYVKVSVTDTFYNELNAIYLSFKLLNSIPSIVVNSVDFSSNTVKRDEECTINLNVTDGDMGIDTNPENLSVYITLQDPTGIKGTPLLMTNNDDWTFELTFSVAINKPIGFYQIIFEVYDQFDINSSYIKTLTVENNLPRINGFTVNDLTIEQSISINYGDDIRFKFNVSDVENTITFINVHLLNERNEWFNVSIRYFENVELTIRTFDLDSGSWYIYLSVIDADGGLTSLTSDYGFAPKEIRIIPDILSPILPWVALIVGVILGFLAGIASIFTYFKTKYAEPKETVPKKKRPKKKKVKEVTKEEEQKSEVLEEKKESDKEFDEKKPLQRKIKRRLK